MSGQPLPPSESFTARRLEHASPEHLHQTCHRTFIGPIPEGWLKSHRKTWYRHHVKFRKQRALTFTAAQPVAAAAEPAPRESTVDGDVRSEEVAGSSSRNNNLLVAFPERSASTISLLHSQHASPNVSPQPAPQTKARDEEGAAEEAGRARHTTFRLDDHPAREHEPHRKVHFSESSKLQLRSRAKRIAHASGIRSTKIKEGEMLKADKMLVRVDITQQTLPHDFDERLSQGVETRTMDKWRELMVVCRQHSEDDATAVLQLYQTRVIAMSDEEKVKKKPKVEILLSTKQVRVNLFSSLDKTLCVWTTKGARTTIYYLRPQCSAVAVEWYTFLRSILGAKRSMTLNVSIPDLSVSLRLDNPFQLLNKEIVEQAAQGDESALAQVLSDEKGVAGAIVARCIAMLQDSPEWADVLAAWKHSRIGLVWKRYDRLEWLHGAAEQKMFGTVAMQRTHDLELRPKVHYPDTTKMSDGSSMEEPTPVEGFLIRLTSKKGQETKMGKLSYKRFYVSSQNEYLLLLRPAQAAPPAPPKLPVHENAHVPSASELSEGSPLNFDIDPYPLRDGHIEWWDPDVTPSHEIQTRDTEAEDEAERNYKMLHNASGFINMCEVRTVREFHRGAMATDENIADDGAEVDFHQSVPDTTRADGDTDAIDENRIFELVMHNGALVRFQAYNAATCHMWIVRLRALVKYWTARAQADMDLYRSTRRENLQKLGIDERFEADIGSFAYKWEVSQSVASPDLYHMCGIAACRPLHLSGTLFRKPRRHTTFERCHVLLAHGTLLIFQDMLRTRTGKRIEHTSHDRVAAISLAGCYLYSGLLTENDLLYQNRTFDPNMPGHHAVPRVYLEDKWTSTDEDAMTTFVIWHAKSKSWFKSAQKVDDVEDEEKEKTKLTRVSQLGTKGRTVVFKARSRAERDRWVLAIQTEIERMMEGEKDEMRIVK